MGEDSDGTPLFSKQWVREHWDDERDQGPPIVQLVKLFHEIHIAIPGTIAAGVVGYTLYTYNAPTLRTLVAVFTAFSSGYALFFQAWWCSTISGDLD